MGPGTSTCFFGRHRSTHNRVLGVSVVLLSLTHNTRPSGASVITTSCNISHARAGTAQVRSLRLTQPALAEALWPELADVSQRSSHVRPTPMEPTHTPAAILLLEIHNLFL